MAASYKRRCCVLKKTKLGETDTILTMLASDGGQVRAVAKGLRKPGSRFGARLEPYSIVDLVLHPGRSLDVVSDARSVATNAACREDLDRSAACSLVAEFLDKATRDGAVAERVFPLTQAAFESIGGTDPSRSALLAAAHVLKGMCMLGFRPALHECAVCGDEVAGFTGFHVESGGVLCPACATRGQGPAIAPGLVSWVDLLVGSTFERIAGVDDAPVRELLDFVESWTREHLSLNLRTMAFLKTLC